MNQRFTLEGVGGWPLDALWMMGSDHFFGGNHRKFSGFGYTYIVIFFDGSNKVTGFLVVV